MTKLMVVLVSLFLLSGPVMAEPKISAKYLGTWIPEFADGDCDSDFAVIIQPKKVGKCDVVAVQKDQYDNQRYGFDSEQYDKVEYVALRCGSDDATFQRWSIDKEGFLWRISLSAMNSLPKHFRCDDEEMCIDLPGKPCMGELDMTR